MGMLIDDNLQFQFELIRRRLKNSITDSNILRWLENFDNISDQHFALEILTLVEYITSYEMLECYSKSFEHIFANIPANSQIFIHPLGNYTKSGTAMVYYAKKALAAHDPALSISFLPHYTEIKNLVDTSAQLNNPIFIFIDDIFGTGNTTIDYFQTYINPFITKVNNLTKPFYFVAIVAMEEAKNKIEKNIAHSCVVSNIVRSQAFSQTKLLFNDKDQAKKIRECCYSYGCKLYKHPLGFKNSQALIVFPYGTPNNTLPIIWADSNNTNWYPIFPRFFGSKLSHAKEIRNELSYWMALVKVFNINELLIRKKIDNKKCDFTNRQNFQLLALLKLIYEKSDFTVICQILGIFDNDLQDLLAFAIKKLYLTSNKQLTDKGFKLLSRIKKLADTQKTSFFAGKSLALKEINYRPVIFRGKSITN